MGFFDFLTKPLKKVGEALGFSDPKIPDSALPQIDQARAKARNQYGNYAQSNFDTVTKNFSNPEYFNPTKYKETYAVTDNIPQPQARNESQYQLGNNLNYGANESTYQYNPSIDVSGYGSKFQALADELKNSPAMTMEGYDPAYQKALIDRLTMYSGEKQAEQEKAANERLSRSGIGASTVGAKTIGDIGRNIAKEVSGVQADVGIKNMEAQREDRYRNQQVNQQRALQAASMIAQAQGADMQANQLSQQAFELARQGRAEDARRVENQAAQARQQAEFARQGRAVDVADQEAQYGRTLQTREEIANENRKAQAVNLQAQQTAAERKQQQYQDAIKMLAQYGEGATYTPESELASQKYAMKKGIKDQRLGNTMNLLTSFI
jgi:hypothetical protein